MIRGWGRLDHAGALQELLRLDRPDPIAVEKLAPILETASRGAPDDDRVWLGRAVLAARTGRLDEARKWLDACLRRRPDDPAVWRARLDLARADEDEAEARLALSHLPDDRLTPAEVLSLRAWFAGRDGDDEAERRALEDLAARDPRALPAMERLAELLLRAGRPERAREVRTLQADRARALDWYVDHIFPADRLDHAPGLARAAETLGRPFEARGWWELAAERSSEAAEARAEIARLDREPKAPIPPALTPSGLLAELGTRSAPKSRAEVARPGGASPKFSDDAEAAGLRFTFDNGFEPRRQLPETMSGGVGLLDYDGDDRLDVYLVQGGPFPPRPDAPNTGDRLFRNKGDGTFEDVSERSGISRMPRGYGHGVAVGDVDNDGNPDLFLTRWRSYALYRNKGDGTFEDATARAGLGGDRGWPTSSAFADLDGDGDLDLYVCHYLKWDSDHPATCWKPERNAYGYCQLHEFPSMPDHLFRNDGGKFVDVTAEAGIIDRAGRGLGVVAADIDGDGRVDLFVTNDESAKFLFLNRGGLKFEEVALAAGVASSASGAYQASMGVAAGDVDSDGRPDLVVTNFYNEYTALYLNLGAGLFADHSADYGLEVASRYRLGFGAAMLDVDDDGRPDLMTANGHVNDSRTDVPWRMPSQLFVGSESGHRFVDVSDRGRTRMAGPAGRPGPGGRRPRQRRPRRPHGRLPGPAGGLLPQPDRGGPFADPPPRRWPLESRRRRRPGDGHGRRDAPGRLAIGRGELPVGLRSPAPLRPRPARLRRRGRGRLALGPGRPLPLPQGRRLQPPRGPPQSDAPPRLRPLKWGCS